MAGSRPQMTGEEIRGGFRMAADEMGAVQGDIKRLAREARIQVLQEDDRKEFFRGMNQDEFDLMHSLAMSMGDNGRNALERLMQEAAEIYGSEKGAQ